MHIVFYLENAQMPKNSCLQPQASVRVIQAKDDICGHNSRERHEFLGLRTNMEVEAGVQECSNGVGCGKVKAEVITSACWRIQSTGEQRMRSLVGR